jgi:phosphatidylglycerophosphatase A
LLLNLKEKIANFLASGFFVGKIPFAPGTIGTLVAVPIMFLYWEKGVLTQVLITISVFLIGFWASTVIVGDTSNTHEKVDPDFIVIDEIAGFMVSMIGIPLSPIYLLIAFVLFRIYDIFKPPPIKWFEKLPSGLGIMADDIIAGIYVLVIMHILVNFFKV